MHACTRASKLPILERRWWTTQDRMYVSYLLNTPAYKAVETYREQCHVMYDILVRGLLCSKHYCAKLLNVDHKSFDRQVEKSLEKLKNGRPSILDYNAQQELFSIINQYHAAGVYPTIRDIHQTIIEMFQKNISISSVRRLITGSGNYKFVLGEPMEAARASLDRESIINYYNELSSVVNDVPCSLVFNIDEAGEDEYVDANSYQVIVPGHYEGETIKIPVKRESKRSTLVHCIAADGTSFKPLLIIPRKTVDTVALKRLNCNNVLIKSQEKGFANTELIKFWLEQIFFPEVQRRMTEEYHRTGYDGYAVLILDGFSCHKKALEAYNLDQMGIKLVYLVPHSSHVTQPLDLIIFAAQKRFTTTAHFTMKLTDQAYCLRKIITGIQKASTTENIVSAFEAAGILRSFDNYATDFNSLMPRARVDMRHARYFKSTNSVFFAINQ